MDDVICDDNVIEDMDDDEEGVISPEEMSAILVAERSREISEWFSIYLAYLEECIIDRDFESKLRRKRSKAKHQLYD